MDGWTDGQMEGQAHESRNKPFLPRASAPSRLRPQSHGLSISSGTHRKRGTRKQGKKEREKYQRSNPDTSLTAESSALRMVWRDVQAPTQLAGCRDDSTFPGEPAVSKALTEALLLRSYRCVRRILYKDSYRKIISKKPGIVVHTSISTL